MAHLFPRLSRDIQEVRGAVAAYEQLDGWEPYNQDDLLAAHGILMHNLVARPGSLRTGGVGVFQGSRVVHMAPPAHLIRGHLENLFRWLRDTDEHPLITGCVVHYELEFIHPFTDGNGRMGRLWQTLILSKWKSLFGYLPVETIVRQRQKEYYAALGLADQQGDAFPFVEFMLAALYDTVAALQSDQANDQGSDQVHRLLEALLKGDKSAAELMEALSLRHAPTFRKNYLNPALESGLVERTLPEKPRSPAQRYRLTVKGKFRAQTS